MKVLQHDDERAQVDSRPTADSAAIDAVFAAEFEARFADKADAWADVPWLTEWQERRHRAHLAAHGRDPYGSLLPGTVDTRRWVTLEEAADRLGVNTSNQGWRGDVLRALRETDDLPALGARGRELSDEDVAKIAARGTCKRGHDLTLPGVGKVDSRGSVVCDQCRREAAEARQGGSA